MNMVPPPVEASSTASHASLWDPSALRDRCLGNVQLMEQVMRRFVATLDKETQELSAAWQSHDDRRLAALAHRLKGTASTVGAIQLELLLREIESLAQAGRLDELQPWFVQLADARGSLVQLLTSNSYPFASA